MATIKVNFSEKSTLDKLIEKKQKIENRIEQIKAKESVKNRKIDTRKKILLGVIFERLILAGEIEDRVLANAVDQHLKTDRDRDLILDHLANLLA